MPQNIEADRRVRRSKETVLKHALDLLSSYGVAGFSIDQLSAESGVAKTTIYRHWPSRSALILDVCSTVGSGFSVPDTGSLRGDLIAFVTNVHSQFQGKYASILPSIMDASERDGEMADLFEAIVEKITAEIRLIVDRAVRRKELRRSMNASDLAASLIGPLVFRRWFLRSSASDAILKKVVDRALE